MKRITLLLVAAVAMMFSTAFAQDAQVTKAGKAVGAGKMKASVSAAYKMKTIKDVDDSVNMIEFSQLGAFSFLSPQAAGLSFAYGITNDMHVALNMPIYGMTSQGDMSTSGLFTAVQAGNSFNTATASPRLGFVYAKNMGAVDVTAAPYITLPFMAMYSFDSGMEGSKSTSFSANFQAPIAFGLNLAVDSATPGKLFWGVWMNTFMSLEKTDFTVTDEDDNESKQDIAEAMFLNLSVLVGYKVAPGMMVKFQLYYDTPNLQAEDKEVMGEKVEAPGFGDGNLKMKVVYGMKLNPTMGIHAGLLYGMGVSDKSSLHDKSLMGLVVDYWVTF